MLGNSREHARADFLSIMECEYKVRPSRPREGLYPAAVSPDGDCLRFGFFMLQAFRQHAQCERLRFCHSLVRSSAVSEHAGQWRPFRDPTPVLFPFVFDGEMRESGYPTILRLAIRAN